MRFKHYSIVILAILNILIWISIPKQRIGADVLSSKLSNEVREKYKLDGTELKKEAPTKNDIAVTIGDKTKAEFTPDFTLTRWENETSFKMKYDGSKIKKPSLIKGLFGATAGVSFSGDKIIYSDGINEVHYYDLPASAENPEGAYEIEYILKEEPDTNVLEFAIETAGLDFFYQPPLTQQEIDEGAQRPENVIGSYAVYHSEKAGDYSLMGGKNYKAGKAFNIYRPLITDSNGKKIWGELNVNTETGILSITIDQKFLDTAVYPVIVDPTFGYSTLGGSITDNENYISAEIGVAPENGTVSSISAGLYVTFSATSTNSWKCALYNWVTDTNAGTIVGETEQRDFTTYTYKDFRIFNISSPPAINTGTSYFIATWSNSSTNFAAQIAFDSGDSNEFGYVGASFGSWPSPLSGENADTYKYSIYATYTASGGGTPAPSTRHRYHIINQ